MIIDFNKLNEMMSNNEDISIDESLLNLSEDGGIIVPISFEEEDGGVPVPLSRNSDPNKFSMKLYSEPQDDRAYSYGTAYFKALINTGNGRGIDKTVRVKYSKAEYIFHGDKRMFTSKERNALDAFFRTHEGMNAFRYLISVHNETAVQSGYKALPLNMKIPNYKELPVEKG